MNSSSSKITGVGRSHCVFWFGGNSGCPHSENISEFSVQLHQKRFSFSFLLFYLLLLFLRLVMDVILFNVRGCWMSSENFIILLNFHFFIFKIGASQLLYLVIGRYNLYEQHKKNTILNIRQSFDRNLNYDYCFLFITKSQVWRKQVDISHIAVLISYSCSVLMYHY